MIGDDELDWADDETESTKVVPSGLGLSEELQREVARDHAYVILLTGNDVGRIFRLEEGEHTIGRSHRADIRLDDDSISRIHCKLCLRAREVDIEDTGSSNGTYVNGERVTVQRLADGDKIRVGETTILKFSFQDRLEENFQRHMYNAALRDALTKSFNRRYFLDQLDKELNYAKRHQTELSLIMIDIDHFKNVNDTYGHVAGDEVLVQLASLAQSMLRTEDVFARYGGEEFAIIARGITLDHGGMLAERLRGAVEAATFTAGGRTLKVTLSLGVAAVHPGVTTPEELIAAADAALYAAKTAGRNRVLLKHAP
jgi:diguanylate cyclase (GGDEF)-like protein